MGVAGAAVGYLLDFFGYIPDVVQSETALVGLALMLTIIPGVFHVIMGGLMFRYKITDNFYETIKAKLNI